MHRVTSHTQHYLAHCYQNAPCHITYTALSGALLPDCTVSHHIHSTLWRTATKLFRVTPHTQNSLAHCYQNAPCHITYTALSGALLLNCIVSHHIHRTLWRTATRMHRVTSHTQHSLAHCYQTVSCHTTYTELSGALLPNFTVSQHIHSTVWRTATRLHRVTSHTQHSLAHCYQTAPCHTTVNSNIHSYRHHNFNTHTPKPSLVTRHLIRPPVTQKRLLV